MSKNQYLFSIPGHADPSLLGTKGLNLEVLCRQGFSVPLTFCLGMNAYRDFVAVCEKSSIMGKLLIDNEMAPGERHLAISDIIHNTPVPDEIQNEILQNSIISGTNSGWAVRSSSNKEDMGNSSFAGLYESYLNIEGPDAVIEAVKQCWASLWSERAIIYREKCGLKHSDVSMSVLIQTMVDAVYSGVIFTRDLNATANNGMLVEYTEGLGDRLVSGQINPLTCKVDNDKATVSYLSGPQGKMLDDDKLIGLCRTASQIEAIFGSPQDIEWTYDGTSFFILQARPITTIQSFQNRLDKLWTRANVGEVLPGVVTPLTWSVFSTMLLENQLISPDRSFSDTGIRLIKGRVYIRVDSFLNSFCYLPFVTPQTMEKVLGLRLAGYDTSYKQPAGVFVRLAQGLFLLNLTGVVPRLAMKARKLPPLDKTMGKGLEVLFQWCTGCFRLHLLCTAYAIGAFAAISFYLNKWMPSQTGRILPLILIGRENLQTAAQGRSLSELACHVQEYPALKKFMKKDFEWSRASEYISVIDGGPQFLSMIEDFLKTNGARTAEEFELALPRWREDPSFVFAVIRKFLEGLSSSFSFAERHQRETQQQEAVQSVINALPIFKRLFFKRLLNTYRTFATLRENMKYRLMEGLAEVRQVFLDFGGELRKSNLLVDRNDVFFLNTSEIETSLRGGSNADEINRIILSRKENYSRLIKEQVQDFIAEGIEEIEFSTGIDPDDQELKGVGCSPGTTEGIARVLHDISETGSLKPGEILVTPHTDPGWTPLFLICKAVVTEIGGFLSHGATVAREYGVPAVVNVTGVTQKIHTGDLIRVDGNNGLVNILRYRANKDNEECKN
jgi:rifampicin phosphotransferase